MKKFKYPLAIEGTEEEQMALIPQLKKIGYELGEETLLRDSSGFKYLVTNFGGHRGGYGFGLYSPERDSNDRTLVPASNPDLVLALAAMVDDDIPHVGEYWYSRVEGLKKVAEVRENDGWFREENDFYISISGKREKNYYNPESTSNRKATKGEIISHFNKNNMNEKENAVYLGVINEPTLSVPVSFIKEAHAAACGEWKRKIEGQFPSIFPKPYKVGERVSFYNEEYLIVGANGRAVLANLKTGKVAQETIAVRNIDNITEEEFLKLGEFHGVNRNTIVTRLAR